MNQSMLFYTAVPVLLGDRRTAGRVAAELYRRHGTVCHWMGQGFHPLLSIYATRHPVSYPLCPERESIYLRLLEDFARRQRPIGGLPCIIPCSKEAADFLARRRDGLEELFALLPLPEPGKDPLVPLLQSH